MITFSVEYKLFLSQSVLKLISYGYRSGVHCLKYSTDFIPSFRTYPNWNGCCISSGMSCQIIICWFVLGFQKQL